MTIWTLLCSLGGGEEHIFQNYSRHILSVCIDKCQFPNVVVSLKILLWVNLYYLSFQLQGRRQGCISILHFECSWEWSYNCFLHINCCLATYFVYFKHIESQSLRAPCSKAAASPLKGAFCILCKTYFNQFIVCTISWQLNFVLGFSSVSCTIWLYAEMFLICFTNLLDKLLE